MIIKILFFIFIVLPIIFYVLSCIFDGIGNAFKAIIGFPDKVIAAYKKDKIRGLISMFCMLLFVLDWSLFGIGLMGVGASVAILVDKSASVYFGVLCGIVGCLLIAVSAFFYAKYLYPEFMKTRND